MIAQIEGGTEAIKAAANHSWEAVIVVVVLLSLIAVLVLATKSIISRMDRNDANSSKREERISNRVTHLEQFIENVLMDLVKETNAALVSTADALKSNTNALDRTYSALEKAEAIAIQSHTATMDLIKRMDGNPCLMGDRDNQTERIAASIAQKLKDK